MTKQEQIMELWRQSFHDPEEFIQFYFSRKYSDENSLVYEENGKALSALLMLPYPMTWQKRTIQTSYISGACTLEKVRNQGFMTLLLKEALGEMNKRGIALSTLIPAEEWLFKYYSNLGYTSVFDYSIEQIQSDRDNYPNFSEEINCPIHYDRQLTDHLFPYFNQKMQERTCCIQHPIDDYHTIVEEVYFSGGRMAVVYDSNLTTPKGWALAVPENGVIKIKEIFYDSLTEKKALIQIFFSIFQSTKIEYQILPQDTSFHPHGMARITDVYQLLQHLASQQPEYSVSLKIYDPQLPVNQGTYLLAKGNCEKNDSMDIPADIETDIPTLTKALLGYQPYLLPPFLSEMTAKQQPYMSLMLD